MADDLLRLPPAGLHRLVDCGTRQRHPHAVTQREWIAKWSGNPARRRCACKASAIYLEGSEWQAPRRPCEGLSRDARQHVQRCPWMSVHNRRTDDGLMYAFDRVIILAWVICFQGCPPIPLSLDVSPHRRSPENAHELSDAHELSCRMKDCCAIYCSGTLQLLCLSCKSPGVR